MPRLTRKGRLRMAPRSSRIFAGSGRVTPPMMTRSRQALPSSAVNSLPISPHLIQVCGKRSISSLASPRMPTICRSSPRAAAESAIRQGSKPPPAMMPSGPSILRPSRGLRAMLSWAWRRGIIGHAERALRLGFDEVDDLLDQGILVEHGLHVLEPLHQRAFAREHHAIRLTQLVDLLAREAFALQSDNIEAAEVGAVANRHAERDDVGGDAGHAADKRVCADADILMHGRESADDGAFADRHMSAQGRAVHQRDVVADVAVVGDVAADHQEAIGAHIGRHMASLGTRIDCDVLADQRVRTDGEGARLVVEFDVLGRGPERHEGEHLAAGAERRAAGDAGVGMHDDVVAEHHMRTDHAEWTDLDIRPEFRAWINQGGRMNFDHARPDYVSTMTALTSASATRLPSTWACARKRHTRPRLRIFCT